MSLYTFGSICLAFPSVTMENLSVLLQTNIFSGPLDPISLCFLKNIILVILLSPVTKFPTIIFHQHNSLVKGYPLKESLVLPPQALTVFLCSSMIKLLEKLSPAISFSPQGREGTDVLTVGLLIKYDFYFGKHCTLMCKLP